MSPYSLAHLSDRALLRDLAALAARDRSTTAELPAHIAEFDARRLYLPAAFPSTYAYCVTELRLSEDAAYKRIQAARVARRFPEIFEALADGRLHLSAVGLLATHLTPANVADLLAAAAGRTKAEVEEMLAGRFPRTESLSLLHAAPDGVVPRDVELAPGQVASSDPEPPGSSGGDASPAGRGMDGFDLRQLAPGQVPSSGVELHDMSDARPGAAPRRGAARLTPVAHERYVLEVTIGRTTREKLRHAQALLSHRLPGGDLAQVIDLALDALNERLERRKLGATQRPRRPRPGADPRYVPAHIRRLVWERDGGRCTFVSESGRRCDERSRLEFDHVEEIARGGRATVPGIRLRCRAHNQHTAECSFGAGLMARRREESRERAAAKQLSSARPAAAEVAGAEAPGTAIAGAPARAEACASTGAGGSTVVEEVFRPLRLLGFSREEARQAAALCEGMEDAPLEQRIKRALTWFQPRGTTRHRSVTPAAGGLVDRA